MVPIEVVLIVIIGVRLASGHYYTGGSYNSIKVDENKMSAVEVAQYYAGYAHNDEVGDLQRVVKRLTGKNPTVILGMFNKKENKMFPQDLQNALDAMRKINNATDMSVLAPQLMHDLHW